MGDVNIGKMGYFWHFHYLACLVLNSFIESVFIRFRAPVFLVDFVAVFASEDSMKSSDFTSLKLLLVFFSLTLKRKVNLNTKCYTAYPIRNFYYQLLPSDKLEILKFAKAWIMTILSWISALIGSGEHFSWENGV